jgi:hypothetical protein
MSAHIPAMSPALSRPASLSSSSLRLSSLRAKLWLGWFCLAALIVSILVGNRLSPSGQGLGARDIGLDYIVFYRAGILVGQGRTSELYDIPLTQDFDRALAVREHLPIGDNDYGPYFYPPFLAWLFVPIVKLGYAGSLICWELIGVACLAIAAFLLSRMIPARGSGNESASGTERRDWRDWMLVPALMLVSLPLIQNFGHGQNACLSLLLATMVVVAWKSGRAFAAGFIVAFLLYKPQLAAVILGVLVLSLGWRALAGAIASGGLLLLITLVTLPGTLTQYVIRMSPNVQLMLSTHQHVWQRHATLKAFWLVLLNHYGPNHFDSSSLALMLTILCGAALAIGLFLCIRRNRTADSHDGLIAATITVMPLLMPYYLDYDLLLLAIPAVLFAADMIGRDSTHNLPRCDVWLIRLWIGLFALLLINPGLTENLHVNFAVPLLCAIAILMMNRCWETKSDEHNCTV